MTLSAEQQEFRAAVRQFAENKIAPRAAELDRTATYSWDNFADCRAMELPALGIPVEFGGSGADSTTQAIMVEELARVCASTALTILISRLATIPILNRGSDELKRRYVPLIASGEKQGSYCLSEPGAGSDVASMQ
ncbi:MAG: acyl-CoA dehydrogenase family protein, partial [Acidimicrobiia bacterium]|nr:acyl-CoA dehydrogenase family protein [Acidimicrobiia bacterium]